MNKSTQELHVHQEFTGGGRRGFVLIPEGKQKMGLVWLCGGAAVFVVSVLYSEAHTTDHQFTLTIALLYFGKCSYAQVLVE